MYVGCTYVQGPVQFKSSVLPGAVVVSAAACRFGGRHAPHRQRRRQPPRRTDNTNTAATAGTATPWQPDQGRVAAAGATDGEQVCIVLGDVTPHFAHIGAAQKPAFLRTYHEKVAGLPGEAEAPRPGNSGAWHDVALSAVHGSGATIIAANGKVDTAFALQCHQSGIVVMEGLSLQQCRGLMALTGVRPVTYVMDVTSAHVAGPAVSAVTMRRLGEVVACASRSASVGLHATASSVGLTAFDDFVVLAPVAPLAKPQSPTPASAAQRHDRMPVVQTLQEPRAIALVLTGVTQASLEKIDYRMQRELRMAKACVRSNTVIPSCGAVEAACSETLLIPSFRAAANTAAVTAKSLASGGAASTETDLWRDAVRAAVAAGFRAWWGHVETNTGVTVAVGCRAGCEDTARTRNTGGEAGDKSGREAGISSVSRASSVRDHGAQQVLNGAASKVGMPAVVGQHHQMWEDAHAKARVWETAASAVRLASAFVPVGNLRARKWCLEFSLALPCPSLPFLAPHCACMVGCVGSS